MNEISKTVSVIGLGYIGLPTAAILASRRVQVIGVDINDNAVHTINRGEIHIVEPQLDVAVRAAVTSGFLRATTTVEPADVFMIAVPTPFKGDHEPELKFIESAVKNLAPVLRKGNLVILESTSPVGTTEQITSWLTQMRPDLVFPSAHEKNPDVNVAYCPERVLPGRVLRELVENDRIIGGVTQKCSEAAASLYGIFVEGQCVVTDSRTAEMCKLTENSFRDVNIAFANELSIVCDGFGIDVWELISLANRHPRVKILQPGAGVGGHCIAVDPWFIVSAAPESAKLIRTAREVNDSKPHWVVEKVKKKVLDLAVSGSFVNNENIVIACYGITFKADIDDIRESPALDIVRELSGIHGENLLVVEPNVCGEKFNEDFSINFVSLAEAFARAHVHVLLVDHKEFKSIRPDAGAIVDTRGIWTDKREV